MRKYVRCPYCGKSDPDDDELVSRRISQFNFERYLYELKIKETRRCDICGKNYAALMHYNFSFEEYAEIDD